MWLVPASEVRERENQDLTAQVLVGYRTRASEGSDEDSSPPGLPAPVPPTPHLYGLPQPPSIRRPVLPD